MAVDVPFAGFRPGFCFCLASCTVEFDRRFVMRQGQNVVEMLLNNLMQGSLMPSVPFNSARRCVLLCAIAGTITM